MPKLFVMVAFMHIPVVGLAEGAPSVPFEVSGILYDWETKQPLEGARFLIFMNKAPFADNDGWAQENDYPNFSLSNAAGEFKARTRLYMASKDIKVSRIEIIIFKEAYRTERLILNQPVFMFDAKQQLGQIKLSDLYLFKTRPQKADTSETDTTGP